MLTILGSGYVSCHDFNVTKLVESLSRHIAAGKCQLQMCNSNLCLQLGVKAIFLSRFHGLVKYIGLVLHTMLVCNTNLAAVRFMSQSCHQHHHYYLMENYKQVNNSGPFIL